MEDLGKAVWYVEAKDAEKPDSVSSGSAVAVWLLPPRGERARNYLLTCGQVVRGASADGQVEQNPVTLKTELQRAEDVFASQSARTAVMVVKAGHLYMQKRWREAAELCAALWGMDGFEVEAKERFKQAL
jgi:hypothetical protein